MATTTDDLRTQYADALRGLTYDNASKSAVRKAVEAALVTRGHDPADASPAAWTSAILRLRMPCRRCAQTGRFITGMHNGVPTGPGGSCFRCNGRGSQTAEDGHRNATHDLHYVPPGGWL